MKRTKEFLIGLAWALGILGVGCATAGPLVLNCGLQDIAILASDYNAIVADYKAKDWTDLVKEAEKVGWATVDCVGSSAAVKDPTLAPAVKEFRQLHSVELRAAGMSACNDSLRGGPAAGQEPHKLYQLGSTPGPATRASSTLAGWSTLGSKEAGSTPGSGAGVPGPTSGGDNHRLTLASCDRACGGRGTSIAPPSGCSCWRPSKTDWRASRWVPLREAPRLGLVAAR